MAPPATGSFVQGLLQSLSPWMTGANPSGLDTSFQQYGGTQGLLDAMLQANTPGNLGRGMEGVQDEALQRAAQRQALAGGNIGLIKQSMLLPVQQAYYRAATGHSAPGAPGAPVSAPGSALGSALGSAPAFSSSGSPLPVAATSPAPEQSGGAFGAPSAGSFAAPTPDSIASIPIGGMTPQMIRLGAILNGQSPLTTAQQLRQQQLAIAQQQYAPMIARLSGVVQSDNPTRDVSADPQLNALWKQYSGGRGFDPVTGFKDANVRQLFGGLANQIRAGLSQPTVAPPIQMLTKTLPDGRTVQVDQLSGKETILPASPVEKVLGPGGQPVNVPLAKAPGTTPYSPFVVTNAQMNGPVGALDAALTQAGVSIPGGRGGQMKLATLRNLLANNPGKSPQEIADMVRTGQLDFNGAKRSTGQLATLSASANAQSLQLEKNFASMEPYVAKMDAMGTPIVNRAIAQLRQNWQTHGDKDTSAFIGYMRAVASEYAKIQSGGTGSAAPAEGEWKSAMDYMTNAFSTGGYAGMKEAVMTEAANKRASYAEGLADAAQPGAGVGKSPQAQTTPNVNAQGWALHVDKNGVKAYVSPDGKQYELVK